MKGCVFCQYTDGTLLVEEKLFVIKGNLYPYVEEHIMIIPKRHIHSLTDMGGEEKKEYFELIEKVILFYKNHFNCCFHLVRENTTNQSQWHYHHHFMPDDNWVGDIKREKYKEPLIKKIWKHNH